MSCVLTKCRQFKLLMNATNIAITSFVPSRNKKPLLYSVYLPSVRYFVFPWNFSAFILWHAKLFKQFSYTSQELISIDHALLLLLRETLDLQESICHWRSPKTFVKLRYDLSIPTLKTKNRKHYFSSEFVCPDTSF